MKHPCLLISNLFFLLIYQYYVQFGIAIDVMIDTSRIARKVDVRFLSVALDTTLARRHWERFDFRSKKIQTLAKALNPCFLRFGGTSADFAIFKVVKEPMSNGVRETNNKQDFTLHGDWGRGNYTNFTFTSTMYDELYQFASSVGWNMTFDLNVLLRKDRKWDATNAKKFLHYTGQQKYILSGLELGNEPNAFKHHVGYSVEPEQLASDFKDLYRLMQQYPSLKDGILLGPSTTQLNKKETIQYFQRFLKAGGGEVVTDITFHQYYLNNKFSTVTEQDFVNPDVLDLLQPEIKIGIEIVNRTASGRKLWLGETSSVTGGGAPGLSDRYIAGFMWLDKLGISSSCGLDVLIRQSFYGGDHCLLDRHTLDPNPDYWLTLLYKILVGQRVLSVSHSDKTGKLRLYAHCTNAHRSGYHSGSITLYGMNLHNKSIKVTLSGQQPLQVYLLQPDPPDTITSQNVRLNGVLLKMKDERTLPPLLPRKGQNSVILPPLTFGFVVLPSANATVCYQ